MAGFKFRLETILNLKEQFEKNAKNELGIAIKKLEEEKLKLKKISDEIEINMKDFKKACTGIIQRETIKELKSFIVYLNSVKERQEENVKKEQENVDKVRDKLVEIMKERKVLEKLKEKEFHKYLKEEERKEQQRIDELVSYKEAAKVDETG
jgi:flagellar FliJ protein